LQSVERRKRKGSIVNEIRKSNHAKRKSPDATCAVPLEYLLCVNRRIHRRLILNSYILNFSFIAFDFIEYEIESIMNFFFILLLSFRGYGIESMSLSRHIGFYPDRSPLGKRVLINGGYHLEAIFYVPRNNETIAINCAPNCNDRQIGSIGAFPGSS